MNLLTDDPSNERLIELLVDPSCLRGSEVKDGGANATGGRSVVAGAGESAAEVEMFGLNRHEQGIGFRS